MDSVGWAAVATKARQRNSQRGEVVAVTERRLLCPVALQSAPRTARAGCVARGRCSPDRAAGTRCSWVPLLVVFTLLHILPGQDSRTSPPSGALLCYLLFQAAQQPLGHEGPPRWSGGPHVVLVSRSLSVCTRPEAERRPQLTCTLIADRADSLRFGVRFSHLFLRAPPGCGVSSPSSCPHWHPPCQEEGVGWGPFHPQLLSRLWVASTR